MHCPKCGNPIKNGDIVCTKCNYPVAMMSGTPNTPTPVYQEVKQVNIEPQIINPTVHVKAPVEKQIEGPVNQNQKKGYQNYGESTNAALSIKFWIPVIIGIIVVIFVVSGITKIIKEEINEHKEIEKREESTTYNLEFNNFIYEIPNEYTYQKNSQTQTLFLKQEGVTITIQVMNATFSSVKSSKASLKSYFQSLGYQVSDVIEETYNNLSYLVLDATKNKKQYILAVTKAGDSSKCFGISITSNTKIEKSYISNITSILKTAKYQNKTEEEKVDFDFKEVIN